MAEQYSYTKLDTFKQCPFKYKLKYINKLKENLDDNLNIQKGSLVHLLLERKINGDTDPNDPELVELLVKLAKEDTMKILKSVKKFINGDFFTALDFSNGIAEQHFYLDSELKPCSKPEAFFTGKIDYIEDKEDYTLIVDWKTGKKTLKEIQLYKADDLQLMIYALWALQKFIDHDTIQAMLYYVETDVPDEKLFTKDDLPAIKDRVMSAIEEIRSAKTFKRNSGPLCDYCNFFADFCAK
jgi:ATP-dependent helicase/DNAse subunit B